MRLRNILGAFALALVLVGPAHADYLSEYKLYNAALDAGDLAGALEHGEAAWRAAETELGDHATTAILALNYANTAAPYAPEKALEAYERALAITRLGEGALNASELELRAAEMRLFVDPTDSKLARELEDLLETSSENAALPEKAMILGWRTLALHKFNRRQFSAAKRAADAAVAGASVLDPRDKRLLAESLIIAGGARVHDRDHSEQEIIEAVALFDSTFELFPPQKDIDHFDPLLARAIAWRYSVTALAASADRILPFITDATYLPTGEDLKSAYERAVERSSIEQQYQWETPHPAHCPKADIWAEIKPPRYPRHSAGQGFVGAALVGYDLNDVGVERTVLLADFEAAGFGEAALKSMEKWRLAAPLPEECRKNYLMNFIFVIK